MVILAYLIFKVFDLTEGGPQPVIELFKKVPNVRLLACGGDGTVGWLLSVLDKVPIDPLPPVGVLPLGTGNDLSRSLGTKTFQSFELTPSVRNGL